MSSSRPSSARLARFMASLLRGGPKNAPDCSGECVPLAGFDVELLTSLCRQSIEFGAPVVLGRAVLERNPAALDQPVKCRIERSLLDQQDIIRATLDRLGDRMTVGGSPPQRTQNEEIECALEELDSTQASFGRHSRWNDRSTHLEGQGGS